MVVKSDGSKWACSSCLKGHRVSGCNHVDRELTLVPKKGRPVTQCHHCRLERKKRSAHVKCDCGETEKVHHPKEKCIHLREAEERAKAGFHEEAQLEKDPGHLAAVAEEQGCCCHHGGKCMCSLMKKEPSDHGNDAAPHGPAVLKPRLESNKSDGSITVFANGHHKPVHRKNNTAHESGMPYRLPLPRAHTDQAVSAPARRSVDSLTHGLPSAPLSTASVSKSEQHSPTLFPQAVFPDSKLSTLDFSALAPSQTNQSMESIDSLAFPPFDPVSATETNFDPWSAYPSSESLSFPNNNPFGAWATNFDNGSLAQPALTAGSSGTQSDIDEIPPIEDFYNFAMPSIAEDSDFDAVFADGANTNRRSLPPNFFGNTDFSSMNVDEWPSPGIGSNPGSEADKSRMASNGTSTLSGDAWSTPGAISSSFRNSTLTGRPQSHSIGPGSAPNDEIIRQLFPDLDVASAFGQGASSDFMPPPSAKRFNSMPMVTSSMQVDLAAVDANGFASQPWTDGSVCVPNDAFASAVDLDQDFASPDFSTGWQGGQ